MYPQGRGYILKTVVLTPAQAGIGNMANVNRLAELDTILPKFQGNRFLSIGYRYEGHGESCLLFPLEKSVQWITTGANKQQLT